MTSASARLLPQLNIFFEVHCHRPDLSIDNCWIQLSGLPSFVHHCSSSGVAMTFSRSLTTLLRTSRHVAGPSRVNPVNRVFGHERFGARTYAEAFTRDKPHVNIGKRPRPCSHCLETDHDRYNRPRRSRQSTYLPRRTQCSKHVY